MRFEMNKTLVRAAALLGLATLVTSCVDHRPIRNGLRDESIYLTKAELTGNNPKLEEAGEIDDGWLFKTTVVKTSAPNILNNFIFPGLEGDLQYVKLRFMEGEMQVLDGRTLQLDDPENPNDDLATQAERVMFAFNGEHVDVQLRESLDGERTNFMEENTERPWQSRQKFRVDFENTNFEPAGQLLWAYGMYANLCAIPRSANLVPGSFEWEAADQYFSFVVDVTYQVNWIGWFCGSLLDIYEWNAQTSNVQYRMAFYRPGPSSYEPEVIGEKDIVNKKYGAFQRSQIFRDPESGLLGNTNLLHRWDPMRTEPVVFYFHEGFPEKFKPMYAEIAEQTNAIMEEAGANLRFDFQEFDAPDADGNPKVRHFGDPRYSFVVWHEGIDTTMGLLGYGPSVSHPKTGEILSASLNLYQIGLDYYRFMIQDFLEDKGGLLKPEADKAWEEIECQEGATVAPGDPVRCALEANAARNTCQSEGGADCEAVATQTQQACESVPRLTAPLFNEMRRFMDFEGDGSTDDFVPTPARPNFLANYHRTLSELRYSDPGWNRYVYRQRDVGQELMDRREKEFEFQEQMDEIAKGHNPFGNAPLHTRDGIQRQLDFTEQLRDFTQNHRELEELQRQVFATKNIFLFDGNDAINAIANGARRCVARDSGATWESDEEYRERIIEQVVFQVAIHELGHNLSLRHNFYGSVDALHMEEGDTSASVMDYVWSPEEAGTPRAWGPYDRAALTWIYGTDEKREEVMQEDFLYCTDDHRNLSPLCTAHDLGITPAQITLNAIERYEWQYKFRNRRAYRTFWNTGSYLGQVYNGIFPIQRMWHLALFDWGGGGVQGTLKRLDQVNGDTVLTDQEYDEIAQDFYNDVSAANAMMIAFYDAIINQPASFRNYQTEFDPFYGDILRMGIIYDKLFATLGFMDQQYVYYSPNVATYVSMWDAPFGTQNFALSQRALDGMLGANYDTFAWFKYYALNIFAWASNSNLVGSIEAKERIAVERFENLDELYEAYGQEVIDFATRQDNPQQTFVYEAEQFVYTYLPDRNWHLVARKSRSPVSYQYMREYNEDLNAGASDSLDNYGLKILLAYHEYFNNFVGF